jgi:predicted TIM-barrel fold metal-dependent hydrolase
MNESSLRPLVIDLSVKPPLEEFFRPFREAGLAGYREAYLQERKGRMYETGDEALQAFLRGLRQARVLAVVRGLDAESTAGIKISNDLIADLVREHPDCLLGMAGVDPHKGREAVRELRRAVTDLGLRGVNFQLMENNLQADDRLLYPIYEACCELDVPVNLHASFHFVRHVRMDISHPRHLDRVAMDFPDLRIIAAPAGFPWVHELIAVAWRHPNVSIGLAAVRPKLLVTAGSGYEPLLTYGRSLLKDRILFASSHPLVVICLAIAEVGALGLAEDVREGWMVGNASRLLGLTGGD